MPDPGLDRAVARVRVGKKSIDPSGRLVTAINSYRNAVGSCRGRGDYPSDVEVILTLKGLPSTEKLTMSGMGRKLITFVDEWDQWTALEELVNAELVIAKESLEEWVERELCRASGTLVKVMVGIDERKKRISRLQRDLSLIEV